MYVKWYFRVILICICLKTSNIEQLFIYLLALWKNIYSCPFPSFELFVFFAFEM